MNISDLPKYTVHQLNSAIGDLLERGFAPRFIIEGAASNPQIKKGHLWLNLTDEDASISAVAWSSTLQKISYLPKDGDGVIVVGKINFWKARGVLNIQILNIRPNLKTVLRQFEVVKNLLLKEGLINDERKRKLPIYPKAIAILTSVPSAALADMLRTASERWPLTKLLIIPIPVQGDAADEIELTLKNLFKKHEKLGIETVIIARGGGSREDLIVFDNEQVCRQISACPVPIITGIGHESDLTVADLVSDFRAATPTGAVIAAMPSKEAAKIDLSRLAERLEGNKLWLIKREKDKVLALKEKLKENSPENLLIRLRKNLHEKELILEALSPNIWLNRGFAIVKNHLNQVIQKAQNIKEGDKLYIELSDGEIMSKALSISPHEN